MIESLKQELLAKENVLLALESEVKKLNQEKVMCDAVCGTSDLIQNLIVLVIPVIWLMLIIMIYMCLSHAMRLRMMILVIFLKVNLILKMMKLVVLKSIQKELAPNS
jgi:hypothetical protein